MLGLSSLADDSKGNSLVSIRKELAEQGHARSQYNLALSYDNGRGVLQDYEEAVKWYRLAAEQGDAGAQYQLALSYDKGHGVPQDYKEAVKWYRLAAKQELAVAQHNLGVSYAKGEGVIQNDVFGYMWLNIAATAGYKASAEDRSKLSARMTASDLSKARQLARECVKKEYKGC